MRHAARPLNTYSIVARQPRTGELGVAVLSHWFSAGSVVSWAEAGVGAVATQSFDEPAYGPRALELMRGGLSAKKALAALLAMDPSQAERHQVAVVDCRGRVAAHTGDHCADAGHHVGRGYSVQANMRQSERIVPAMAEAFETSRAPLAERLLAALQAAANAGGGAIRGRQSAAILVVRGTSSGAIVKDRLIDLRADNHPTPIRELARLLELHRAYEHVARGDQALGRGNHQQALAEYRAAAELAPDNLEIAYWHAVALALGDQLEDALPLFRRVFAQEPQWIEFTRRLHTPGVIPDTAEGRALIDQILRQAPATTPQAAAQ